MLQNLMSKPAMAQPLFSLNMPGVDELFPGFAAGDFAVLYRVTISYFANFS